MISRLRRVPLREVWRHEANDFTTWLKDNIDLLGEISGLELSSPEREHPTGNFSVDLVAEDQNGNAVAIENQLEQSNHDHLGKVLTYLAAVEAKTAFWIVSEPRAEHVKAIAWLNEAGVADFYMVKVEAVRIDDSPAAPLLTLIVGPSAAARVAGETKKELSERHDLRIQFWTEFLPRAAARTRLHAGSSPTKQNWIEAGAGKPCLRYNYLIRQHDTNEELYIDRGAGRDDENRAIFENLISHRSEIETTYGGDLSWQPLEGRRACRIASPNRAGGYRDEDEWEQIHAGMIDSMIRLEQALRPFVSSLPM